MSVMTRLTDIQLSLIHVSFIECINFRHSIEFCLVLRYALFPLAFHIGVSINAI